MKCPSCGKELVESGVRLGIKPARVKEVPEDLVVQVTTVYKCVCGTEVAEREVMEYHLVGR